MLREQIAEEMDAGRAQVDAGGARPEAAIEPRFYAASPRVLRAAATRRLRFEDRPTAGLDEHGLARCGEPLADLDLVVRFLEIELALVHVLTSALDEPVPEVQDVGVIPKLPYVWSIEVERLNPVPLFEDGPDHL